MAQCVAGVWRHRMPMAWPLINGGGMYLMAYCVAVATFNGVACWRNLVSWRGQPCGLSGSNPPSHLNDICVAIGVTSVCCVTSAGI